MKLDYRVFDGETKLIPLIGYPLKKGAGVSSAFSEIFRVNGINAISLPMEVEKGHIGDFLEACKVFHVDKFSLTMPHKADVIPFLDEVDTPSRLFHSVNQVTTVDGKLVGKGFDGIGTIRSLEAVGAKLKGANVMMIGAGSISGVIGYELAQSGVEHLTILNRTVANAQNVGQTLADNTNMKVSWGGLTEKELDDAAAKANVLVQVSAQGMAGMPQHPYLGFLAKLPKDCVVMEGVIAPVETEFVIEARKQGFDPALGLDMAANQAAAVVEFLFPGTTLTRNDAKLVVDIICDSTGLPVPKHWQT
ncbi:MAG: hypothetical protein GXY32_09225 [Ruminococcaceae bacterium]|nr:hypothetical protein [Oscillospiraceae bacterium]